MGVQRLQTYIEKYSLGKNISLKSYGAKGFRIIIDGDSVSFFLYESASLPRIFGGEYFELRQYIDNFFKTLKDSGIEMTVVYDGIPPEEKRSTIQQRRKTKCNNSLLLY